MDRLLLACLYGISVSRVRQHVLSKVALPFESFATFLTQHSKYVSQQSAMIQAQTLFTQRYAVAEWYEAGLCDCEVAGSTPARGCCVPTPTQRAIPPGSVNE